MANTGPTLSYRADIDGLRAVAVLAVVFCHLQLLKLGGGFVGVDVFFVISGYLISSVILREVAETRFTLASFYERRIRRILPALVVMMAATVLAACAFLLPLELESFARSLFTASLGVSNFFWMRFGYFDAPAGEQPLLHTWSLAVEEQFYIFFPLFLMFVRRFFPGRFRLAILMLAASSFVLSVVGTYQFPTVTYYLPATRAWELLLGTTLSLRLFPEFKSALWRNIASTAGLLMIVVTAFKYTGAMHFPGLAAVPPCLGAALIIAAGNHGKSYVGRLLSLKPVVFVGLISYSLYLWHWPIFVFQKMGMIQTPGALPRNVKLGVLAVSFLAATVSWKYVETPFRKGRFYLSGAAPFKFAGVTTLGLVVAVACILGFRGFPARYTAEQIKVASYGKEDISASYRIGSCYITSGSGDALDTNRCMRSVSTRKNYLLLGDSHAAHLWYGLSTVFGDINFLEAAYSGCEPTVSHKPFDEPACVRVMDYVFKDYLPQHHVDEVLLAARWEEEDIERLDETISALKRQGVPVTLFGPIMEYDAALPRLLASSLGARDPMMPTRHQLSKYRALDGELSRMAASRWKVPYISYFKLLCPGASCTEYAAKDVPLQIDYGHLSKEGSVLVAQRLKDTGALGVGSQPPRASMGISKGTSGSKSALETHALPAAKLSHRETRCTMGCSDGKDFAG